ncbi:MAG: hypothetical protein ACPH6D_05125, partial [Candidatus Puniceispirillales bacterium]
LELPRVISPQRPQRCASTSSATAAPNMPRDDTPLRQLADNAITDHDHKRKPEVNTHPTTRTARHHSAGA